MDYPVESIGVFVAGAILYAILSNVWRAYTAKNVEILTIYDLEAMRLPTTEKDFSHIFTTKNNEKRKEKAKILLKAYEATYSEAHRSVQKRQDVADDERRELERIAERVDDCDTKGARENLVHVELTPSLNKFVATVDALAVDLNRRENLESPRLFLDHVASGQTRTQVLENFIERTGLVSERDTKMKEAANSAYNSLKLGDATLDKIIEKYVEKI